MGMDQKKICLTSNVEDLDENYMYDDGECTSKIVKIQYQLCFFKGYVVYGSVLIGARFCEEFLKPVQEINSKAGLKLKIETYDILFSF